MTTERMTTEQLPDGLQLAVEIIESTLAGPNARSRARSAIRAEHAQRLTLQRLHDAATAERDELAHGHRSQHDADSAELRRVCADRDAARKERDELRARLDASHAANLVSESEAKITAMQAAFEERLTLDRANRLLVARIADMEAQRNTTAAHVASIARQLGYESLQVDGIAVRVLGLVAERYKAHQSAISAAVERDELRAKYDELLVALHGIGAALGIPEGDRSPYSVTCGTLERVNRLAEIEAQEPGKRRQAVLLTRQQIDDVMTQHYPLESLLRENVDAFESAVRDVESAVLAANNLEGRRG